jgi:hypothetical protein
MPNMNGALVCAVCKTIRVRFRIEILNSKYSAHVCSVKCLLTWALQYSMGSVQDVVQRLLKGLPK